LAGRTAVPSGVTLTIGGLIAAGEMHPHPDAATAMSIAANTARPRLATIIIRFLSNPTAA
jgi:hypothetical protein